jgi:glycosyltransferase involved in cell wall biosynthesis
LNKNIAFVVVFHNAASYAPRVLEKVIRMADSSDEIVVIADGCTDSTSEICREILTNFGKPFQFQETEDLHEIGAINVALSLIKTAGFVLHLQGDMVMDAQTFPIVRDFLSGNREIGVLSLRMGGCFHSDDQTLELNEMNFGHNFEGRLRRKITVNTYEYCVAGRGPLLFNREILKSNNGQIDNSLKPHSMDDVDMSLISLKLGYKNYAVNLPYRSDITWGATRNKNRSYLEPVQIAAEKNLLYVKGKHSNLLKEIAHNHRHPILELGTVNIGIYFMLGLYINRELLHSENKKLRRLRRKIAFTLSQLTV